MSQDQPSQDQSPPYSSPTSGGGLFLRVLIAALVLAALIGGIWYFNK